MQYRCQLTPSNLYFQAHSSHRDVLCGASLLLQTCTSLYFYKPQSLWSLEPFLHTYLCHIIILSNHHYGEYTIASMTITTSSPPVSPPSLEVESTTNVASALTRGSGSNTASTDDGLNFKGKIIRHLVVPVL
jgi:hypothetical protein